MKKIEAVMRSGRFEAVKMALGRIGVKGITVGNVLDYGLQDGRRGICRGTGYIKLLPKVKVEVVVQDAAVGQVVEAMREAAPSEEFGDCRVFVYPVETAVKIGKGELATLNATKNGA